ncbi:hypothetical protein M9979_12300 [Sphingomonas sp. RP10(2022)]|uniref:Uncharacterized protein n=1 Tax=Sphingomonas liriopis TaxID=2949094 RepID=A0A9X2KR52_9SPHN|nr:hypothetical protein [Sphingomonas liriopis]MCP3735655.1 hypothetical protein [Sphingomonas liriopis]
MNIVATTQTPPAFRSTAVVPGWLWRTHNEGDIAPSQMRTTHLFFTLRMIWNHSMPTSMRVGRNVKLYSFGARHDARYMRSAIVHIGAELFRRTDLPAWMKRELDEMAAHMRDVEAQHFIAEARALTFAGAA